MIMWKLDLEMRSGGIVPYMGIGMFAPKRHGFLAVLVQKKGVDFDHFGLKYGKFGLAVRYFLCKEYIFRHHCWQICSHLRLAAVI